MNGGRSAAITARRWCSTDWRRLITLPIEALHHPRRSQEASNVFQISSKSLTSLESSGGQGEPSVIRSTRDDLRRVINKRYLNHAKAPTCKSNPSSTTESCLNCYKLSVSNFFCRKLDQVQNYIRCYLKSFQARCQKQVRCHWKWSNMSMWGYLPSVRQPRVGTRRSSGSQSWCNSWGIIRRVFECWSRKWSNTWWPWVW